MTKTNSPKSNLALGLICGQKFWNTFGPQTWEEIANHHHWLAATMKMILWQFTGYIASKYKRSTEATRTQGKSVCQPATSLPDNNVSSTGEYLCIFSFLIGCKRSIVFFKYSCCIFLWWWWEYLNKPFHPTLPGLLGEVDKSRSFLIPGRLSTKKSASLDFHW